MEQIEIISWAVLNAIKENAQIVETVGDMDTEDHFSVFCTLEDDYLELFYSETDSNYIRHFVDEEEFEEAIVNRKEDFGDNYDVGNLNYYSADDDYDEEIGDNYDGFRISTDDEEDTF